MPCTAMNAADSGPPKPALALLAMRAMPKSVALTQRRAFQRSHSQFAEPMWSGCMWVQMTRSTGSPSSPVANTSSQAARVLISGDMVLPRISTNVSVVDVEPEADPLTLYLDSIERMRAIDAGALVLPSHGLPFKGLHTRIDQLQAHHAERFAETLEACAEAPQSAFELVPVLFKRPLDLHQMTFAMGESLAHLHALWFRGKLERMTGADGVIRFATV